MVLHLEAWGAFVGPKGQCGCRIKTSWASEAEAYKKRNRDEMVKNLEFCYFLSTIEMLKVFEQKREV